MDNDFNAVALMKIRDLKNPVTNLTYITRFQHNIYDHLTVLFTIKRRINFCKDNIIIASSKRSNNSNIDIEFNKAIIDCSNEIKNEFWVPFSNKNYEKYLEEEENPDTTNNALFNLFSKEIKFVKKFLKEKLQEDNYYHNISKQINSLGWVIEITVAPIGIDLNSKSVGFFVSTIAKKKES